MSTAIFVGRFQPFHKGHLLVVKEIAKNNDRVLILIGSSQEANTFENPFSVEERRQMIERALTEANISKEKYEISGIEDAFNDVAWIDSLRRIAKFDIAYANNITAVNFYKRYKIPYRSTIYFAPYKGEDVRRKIYNKESWKEQVPDSVYAYIQEIGGEKRIQNF